MSQPPPAYKHSDLTGKIIGCAMEVHRHLGNGFQEIIYQRALAIEMQQQGLGFSREHEMQIQYKGIDIGTRRAAILILTSNLPKLPKLERRNGLSNADCRNYSQ